MVLPPIPLRSPSNPSFAPSGKLPPPPQFLPQGLPPVIGADRNVPSGGAPPTAGVQVLPNLQSNTAPNLLPRPPVRPKGPMAKGDQVMKSKSATSVFESPQQREQIIAKAGPKKGLAPTPAPRSHINSGLKAPSPRGSSQLSQLNATLTSLCNEINEVQQQRESLDQQIQNQISMLNQEIDAMSKGGGSDNWTVMKGELEELHQQELDLTVKYADVSKSIAETRQSLRLAELQQQLEHIESKDSLSETTPRY